MNTSDNVSQWINTGIVNLFCKEEQCFLKGGPGIRIRAAVSSLDMRPFVVTSGLPLGAAARLTGGQPDKYGARCHNPDLLFVPLSGYYSSQSGYFSSPLASLHRQYSPRYGIPTFNSTKQQQI
jgi:hypothetical protein